MRERRNLGSRQEEEHELLALTNIVVGKFRFSRRSQERAPASASDISSLSTAPLRTSHHTYRHYVPHRHCPQRASRRYPGCSPSSTNVRCPLQPFHWHIPHHHPGNNTLCCSMLCFVIWSWTGGGYWQNLGSFEELRQGTMSSKTGSTRGIGLIKTFALQVQDASKLSAQSHFTNDLGLDSLDTVEVVMAIEEVRGVIYRNRSARWTGQQLIIYDIGVQH